MPFQSKVVSKVNLVEQPWVMLLNPLDRDVSNCILPRSKKLIQSFSAQFKSYIGQNISVGIRTSQLISYKILTTSEESAVHLELDESLS